MGSELRNFNILFIYGPRRVLIRNLQMPYLHWETDRMREKVSRFLDEVTMKHQKKIQNDEWGKKSNDKKIAVALLFPLSAGKAMMSHGKSPKHTKVQRERLAPSWRRTLYGSFQSFTNTSRPNFSKTTKDHCGDKNRPSLFRRCYAIRSHVNISRQETDPRIPSPRPASSSASHLESSVLLDAQDDKDERL